MDPEWRCMDPSENGEIPAIAMLLYWRVDTKDGLENVWPFQFSWVYLTSGVYTKWFGGGFYTNPTRWAATNYKWSYAAPKTGVTAAINGVIWLFH